VGRKSYDLFDDPADILNKWPLLEEVLRTCERVIGPAYVRSDRLAWFFQKPHRWITGAGALTATLAVLCAILQLAFPELVERSFIRDLELLCAAGAMAFVVLASIVALKFLWMVERHRSERLRFAKFRFLIDPETWFDAASRAARAMRLEDEVRQIQAVTHREFREWAEGAVEPVVPLPPGAHSIPPGTRTLPPTTPIDQLTDYYRTKRLDYQRHYFENRAKLFASIDVLTK
jgi:hypothetical protein